MGHFSIFVSGQPSCGKTTLIKRVVQTLRKKGVRVKGFITEEVLEKGGSGRAGFDIVGFGKGRQKRGVLARKKGSTTWPSTGPYKVNVASFEQIALPLLDTRDADVVVIDEIGRMELHSERFKHCISKLLGKIHIFGSIAAPRYGHVVPFCETIKTRRGVKVLHLKKSSRTSVFEEALALVKQGLAP